MKIRKNKQINIENYLNNFNKIITNNIQYDWDDKISNNDSYEQTADTPIRGEFSRFFQNKSRDFISMEKSLEKYNSQKSLEK